MIAVLSKRLAYRLKEIHPSHPISVEVLTYALATIINVAGTIIVSLTVAAILGQVLETILAMVAFAVLRALSGGIHLKSSVACILITSAGANLIPLAAEYVTPAMLVTMSVISMGLAAVFATRKIENQTRIPRRFFPHLRVLSVLLIGTNLIIQSPIIAVTFFIQSILLIRRR